MMRTWGLAWTLKSYKHNSFFPICPPFLSQETIHYGRFSLKLPWQVLSWCPPGFLSFPQGLCTVTAAFLHFFFLASFCWVLTEAWQSYLAVLGKMRPRLIRKRFLCLGWGELTHELKYANCERKGLLWMCHGTGLLVGK